MAAATGTNQLVIPKLGPPSLSLNLASMESPPERPSSALARGVKFTEYKDSRVNPDPVTIEDSEILLEDYLSPRKLRDLTGVDDLEEVRYLEMKVDTRDTSLGNFGCHLPNLSQLKLSNSIITTVRDLGSSLNNLRVLWMARCGLEDIDGISAMVNLTELYLAYNEICDISPCSMLEHLRVLDLEGNNLDDIAQIEYLAMCQGLVNLTLEGNPVCVTPSPDEVSPNYDYREAVQKMLLQIGTLDDEPVDRCSHEPRRTASVFDDDWRLIEEMLEDGTMDGSDESVETLGRPGSAIRPTTGYRPGSALKQQRPGSAIRPPSSSSSRPSSAARPASGRPGSVRPVSALFRPGSADRRPPTASYRPSSTEEDFGVPEESSDLTRGTVVCGNPSKALRARTKHSPISHPVPALLAKYKHKPEKSYTTEKEMPEGHLKELLSELQAWKIDFRQRQNEIDSSKAPQVLKIEHDDSMDLSESDHELSSESDEELNHEAERQRIKNYGALTPTQSHKGARPKSSNRQVRRHPSEDESFSSGYSPSLNGKSPVSEARRSPSPVTSVSSKYDEDGRPTSGPVIGSRGKFRLEANVDKSQKKIIDKQNPVIRTALQSPEKLVPDGPRGATAQAALGPLLNKGGLRNKALGNVQLLPSRKLPTIPK